MPPHSKELVVGLGHARRLAAQEQLPVTSRHLLLALFAFTNKTRALFAERQLDESRLQTAQASAAPLLEPQAMAERLCQRAAEVALGVNAAEVNCLHLLVAISRSKESEAYRLLERTGLSVATLRHVAVASMTGSAQRRSFGRPQRRRTLPNGTRNIERRQNREGEQADGDAPLHEEDLLMGTVERLPLWQQTEHDCRAADTLPQPLAHEASGASSHPLPLRQLRHKSAEELATMPLGDFAPTLAECGLDLTAQAHAGRLDPVIARDTELAALADVLGKRRANNPVLVGPPGVGKTAIVEGLALLWAAPPLAGHKTSVGPSTARRRIVALDTGAMVAGTSLRGSFSERLGAIKNEVAEARGHLVVFIDELHMLIGAGASGEGPQDAAGELKAALARGDFPCIGATTDEEYKRYIEKDPALERRFTTVKVLEPSCEQACRIVRGAIGPYASHHDVAFEDAAIDAAVHHSHRFVPERKLPDKAFAVLDLAGSRAHRAGRSTVTREDVCKVVHEWTGVPMERLTTKDAARFASAESHLSQQLIGHHHVVQAVAKALRRGFAGFNAKRPMGSFLFLGPTGVGKTEMVKVLAEFVFGQRSSILRFDMSELVEKHSVARLLGAQPGYVGYEEGGQLTEALRKRPFQIVLFDEIEKAHPEVTHVLLQILDEGHLTDTQGRRISFAHTIIVLTSNLGSETFFNRQHIGFSSTSPAAPDDHEIFSESHSITQRVLNMARSKMSPELWSRLDEHLVFLPLTEQQATRIAALQLQRKSRDFLSEHGIAITWDAAILPFLVRAGGFNPQHGARGLRKTIAEHIEAPLSDLILKAKEDLPSTVHLGMENDILIIKALGAHRS